MFVILLAATEGDHSGRQTNGLWMQVHVIIIHFFLIVDSFLLFSFLCTDAYRPYYHDKTFRDLERKIVEAEMELTIAKSQGYLKSQVQPYSGRKLLAVIGIYTSFGGRLRRNVIRSSWMSDGQYKVQF